MPDPTTIERLKGLILSAKDLRELTDWPGALIEDYLNILDNIIVLATLLDIEIDQKIEEIPTDFLDGSIPFAEDNLLVEDNTNLFWDSLNNILNVLNITLGGVILLPRGSAAVPSFSFIEDTDTGIHWSPGGGGAMRFAVAAGDVFDMSSGDMAALVPFGVSDGAVGALSLRFFLDPNTGIYRPGNDQLGIVAGGVEKIRLVGGAVQLGGIVGGNYTEFEADGTMKMVGDATVWDDINMGSALLTKPAASAPDTDQFKDEGGNDTGIETYAFAPGEKVSGLFEIPHAYKEGSDVIPHVHFQIIDAPTGTDKVKWQLIYTVAKLGETLDATTTIVVEQDVDTQYEFHSTAFAAITGTNFNIEDQFLFQLSRVTASATEFAGDALIATFGLHYEIDTVGSRQTLTK